MRLLAAVARLANRELRKYAAQTKTGPEGPAVNKAG